MCGNPHNREWSDAYVLTRYIPFAELIPMLGVTPEFGENSTLRNLVEYF